MAFGAIAGADATAAPRDWQKFPAVVELPLPKHLYAIGDVHGDYQRLVQLLAAGELLAAAPDRPEDAKWTGEKAVLVCTGDLINRSDHSLQVIALFRTLQTQAAAAGGRVIVTMGNHEAEFLATGPDSKKAADFGKEIVAAGMTVDDVVARRDAQGVGEWLRNLPMAAKVGEWFFCHAGNTGGLTLAKLETDIETQVAAHGFGTPILTGSNSLLEARMHPRPWWESDPAGPKLKAVEPPDAAAPPTTRDSGGEKRLRDTVEALGAKHLVFGHQPGKTLFADGTARAADQMYSKFDGLVFMIDTGMSRGVDSGRGALLHIHIKKGHQLATAIYADGKKTQLLP